MKPGRSYRISVSSVAAVCLIQFFGCEKVRDVLRAEPPEGVVQKSYAIEVTGYEKRVDVSATPEEISNYLSDPSRFLSLFSAADRAPGDTAGDRVEPSETRPGPVEVGRGYPAAIRLGAVEIPGQVVYARMDKDHVWVMWEGQYGYLIFKYRAEPTLNNRSRVTFDTYTVMFRSGILSGMERTAELIKVKDLALEYLDLLLARLQAEFDPELEVRELLEKGPTGKEYKAILQVYETQVWINADPEKVKKWLIDPPNGPVIIGEFKVDPSYFERMNAASPREFIYSDGYLEVANLKSQAHVFTTRDERGKSRYFRMYMVALNTLGLLKIDIEPDAGGSILTSKMMFEVPSSASSKGIDFLFILAGLPERLQQRVLLIKNGVEASV